MCSSFVATPNGLPFDSVPPPIGMRSTSFWTTVMTPNINQQITVSYTSFDVHPRHIEAFVTFNDRVQGRNILITTTPANLILGWSIVTQWDAGSSWTFNPNTGTLTVLNQGAQSRRVLLSIGDLRNYVSISYVVNTGGPDFVWYGIGERIEIQ